MNSLALAATRHQLEPRIVLGADSGRPLLRLEAGGVRVGAEVWIGDEWGITKVYNSAAVDHVGIILDVVSLLAFEQSTLTNEINFRFAGLIGDLGSLSRLAHGRNAEVLSEFLAGARRLIKV